MYTSQITNCKDTDHWNIFVSHIQMQEVAQEGQYVQIYGFFGRVSHVPGLLLIHYVAEDDHELLLSLRLPPPKCWEYRYGQLVCHHAQLFSIRDQTQVFMFARHGLDLKCAPKASIK